MKKLIFGLIAAVMFGNLSFGQKMNDLNLDENFVNFISNELTFKERANVSMLRELLAKPLSQDNIYDFYKTYSTNEKEFINFINSQNLILRNLSLKYDFKSYSQDEFLEILNVEVLEVLSSKVAIGRCKDRYLNDLSINFSVAVAGHIACGTADITVILGVICHGAVLIGQNAANNNAYLNYLDCIGK